MEEVKQWVSGCEGGKERESQVKQGELEVQEARSVYLDVEDVKQWVSGIKEARSGNLRKRWRR